MNLIIVVFSALTNLVVFTGALLLLLYLGVMVAALVVRRRKRPPYRMPGWPVLPAFAVVAILLLLTQQSLVGILVTLAMVAVGVVWSFFHLNPSAEAPFFRAGRKRAAQPHGIIEHGVLYSCHEPDLAGKAPTEWHASPIALDHDGPV